MASADALEAQVHVLLASAGVLLFQARVRKVKFYPQTDAFRRNPQPN